MVQLLPQCGVFLLPSSFLVKLIVSMLIPSYIWFRNSQREFQKNIVFCFYSLQTEKELSKLMSRAMKEGLEGLVLKDVNVMQKLDFFNNVM